MIDAGRRSKDERAEELTMAIAQEDTRDSELCEEIVRTALSMVTARKPQEFLKAQTFLLQASEELHILRTSRTSVPSRLV